MPGGMQHNAGMKIDKKQKSQSKPGNGISDCGPIVQLNKKSQHKINSIKTKENKQNFLTAVEWIYM